MSFVLISVVFVQTLDEINLSMDMRIVLIWTYFKLGVLLNYVAHMCVASVLLLWLLSKVSKHFGDTVNLWSNGAHGEGHFLSGSNQTEACTT